MNMVNGKVYYEMDNVGSSKYSVNFYDGISKHKDGSPFFEIHLFKNKKKKLFFINELKKAGYIEISFSAFMFLNGTLMEEMK